MEDIAKHQEGLMKFALQLTHNKQDAEDLMQDTYLRALENKLKYDNSKSSELTWLKNLMQNIFLNDCKKQSIENNFQRVDITELAL